MGVTDPEVEDDQDPIQQSVEIHRRRIIVILERMLEKFGVALCMEKLFDSECELVTNLVPVTQYNSLIRMGQMYSKGSLATTTKSIGSSTFSTKGKIRKSPSSSDFATSIMIAYLHHNQQVMEKVGELLYIIPEHHKEFLEQVKNYINHILETLNTSAVAERIYCKQIGQAWIKNEKYKRRNVEMAKIHSETMYELSFKINKKNAVIHDYKDQMEQSQERCITELHRIVNESEKKMTRTTAENEENMITLTEEAKNITTKYQTLLESHLSREKTLRIKRYKVETVLASWLTKYDTDIGELQAQLEEQLDGYHAEKSEFDELTAKFTVQTIQYDELMAEKAEEEQIIFDAKRVAFIQSRSARKIQRWWRAILSRRKARRRGRKGKKKK